MGGFEGWKNPWNITVVNRERHGRSWEITIDHDFHDLFFLSYLFFLKNSELLDNQRVTGCYAKR